MNSLPEPCMSTDRESNVSRMDAAIENLASACNALEHIREELRGEAKPECGKEAQVRATPCAWDIMRDGPDKINGLADRIRNEIGAIKEIF